jgi:parafibromin
VTSLMQTFLNIRKMGNDLFVHGKIKNPNAKTERSATNAPQAQAAASTSRSSRQQLQQKTIPIIIVPASTASAMTLFNIESFLSEGVFIPSDFSKTKQSFVTFQRTKASRVLPAAPGKTVALPLTFQVYDSVDKFSKHDWKRVVAVFATGAAWQFSHAAWGKRQPVEIFNDSECGFLIV